MTNNETLRSNSCSTESVTGCPTGEMGTKKIYPEDIDEEETKCPYKEAGKTILGQTTFHGLPWLTVDISPILKVTIFSF